MSTGLLALLDDVAAIAKAAAASLDDVAAQATKAGTKAAGLVIDDTAVTPRYVVGLSPARELPMIWRITLGSLRNKLVFLLPAALLLSYAVPWAITPLLMLGGLYLCYEGAEKVLEAFFPHAAHGHEETVKPKAATPEEFERSKVGDAVRTDFILSAEIMAVTLSVIPTQGPWQQAAILAVVGILITVGVYGTVALIVKADDIGLALARNGSNALRAVGRGLVIGTPRFLKALAAVGTAAMLWVGGGIIVHGLEVLHVDAPAAAMHAAGHSVEAAGPAAVWAAEAAVAGIGGTALGLAVIQLAGPAASLFSRFRGKR